MGEKKDEKVINTTTVGMAQSESIQRNGEAASQIIQAFKGTRYDSNGIDLGHQGRSLKQISEYKVNEDYKNQNIKQQSGFSAELVQEARENSEAIRNKSTNRTRTTDGIGRSNDQKYDHVVVDDNGSIIKGSEAQMKFLKTPEKLVDNIVNNPKWKKYDGFIDIPEDQYDDALKYASDKAESFKKQAEQLRSKGENIKAEELEKKSENYEKSKSKIRKSKVKESESIEARVDPKGFVTKEVIKESHNSAKNAVKATAIISSSISIGQNLMHIFNGEKTVDEAMIDVITTTGKSSALAYGVTFSGTALKSVMHASENSLVRNLGTTNLPDLMATSVVEVSKSIKRYAKAEINELELMEELGEKGTGMIVAGYGAAVGSIVGGTLGTIVPGVGNVIGAATGGFLGSMISYSMSSIIYKGTLDAFKEVKLSEERREMIEALSKESIRTMKKYQQILTEYGRKEYQRRENLFNDIFDNINSSLYDNNINGFVENINKIGEEFGMKLSFKTFEEFDDIMNDENFILTL